MAKDKEAGKKEKDLYFLGRVIANKQRMVWLSVIVFLGGLAIVGVYLAITVFSQ